MSRPCCSRDYLKFDAAAPHWPDRDRFVLSAGHGSMLLYALLHLTGYAARRSRTSAISASCTAPAPGTLRISSCRASRTTTGPLGQGLAMASAWRWPSGI
jgi:transketolase